MNEPRWIMDLILVPHTAPDIKDQPGYVLLIAIPEAKRCTHTYIASI